MADDEDVEDRRRERNSRRWRLHVRSERAEWMDAIASTDPALHAELEALRALAPQEWRKRLVAEAKKLGLYALKAFPERATP